jgi:hypothetical protein
LQAYIRRFQGIPTIVEAEVIGMREALQWLLNNNRKTADIEVESDCLQASNKCNAHKYHEFGSLIDMC